MARRVEFESLFIICMRNVSWTVVDGGAKQVRKRQLTVQRPENRRTVQQAACNVQRATCATHERGEAFIFLFCASRVSISIGAVDRIISSSSITATPMPMPMAAVH